MSVSDEHFEEMVQGIRPESDDLDQAQRQDLAEARAIRSRLRSAFENVVASDALAERIRGQLATTTKRDETRAFRARRIIWRLAPLAAVAAVVVVAMIFVSNLSQPGTAQAELASIHEGNLSSSTMRYGDDPAKLAAFLRQKLGTEPALPKGDDVDLYGCCTVKFRGKSVVSYMVRLGGKRVSIVIASVDPDTLGFRHKFTQSGRTFWGCGSGPCSMVSMVLGDYTYIAVGETGHDELTSVLMRLLPAGNAAGGSPR